MILKNWLSVIVIPIAIALILYFIVFPSIENQSNTELANRLNGVWESKLKNVTITFNTDGTFTANNNGTIYNGRWEVTNSLGNYINLNWEGFYADYMALFNNDRSMSLVGVNEPSGLVELVKI